MHVDNAADNSDRANLRQDCLEGNKERVIDESIRRSSTRALVACESELKRSECDARDTSLQSLAVRKKSLGVVRDGFAA